MTTHTKSKGRPPSPDPRFVLAKVRLTAAEAAEANRLAALEGVSVSEVLRRGIGPTRPLGLSGGIQRSA